MTATPIPTDRRALLLAVYVVLAAGALLEERALNSPGVDFWHFHVVPRAMRSGVIDDPYTRPGREALRRAFAEPLLQDSVGPSRERAAVAIAAKADLPALGYPGITASATPFFYALISMLFRSDYETDYRRFALLSVLVLLGSIFALARLAGHDTPAALILAGVGALTLEPVFIEAEIENVNNLELAGLTAFLWLQNRGRIRSDVWAGVVLGLAVAFKPNLGPPACAVGVTWVALRRWRRVLALTSGVAVGTATGMLVPVAMFGRGGLWSSWVVTLPQLGASRSMSEGNYSVPRLLLEATGIEVSSRLLPLFLVPVVVAALWRGRAPGAAREGVEPTWLALGLGSVAMLIGSKLVWTHYYILALPLLLWLTAPAATPRPWQSRLAVASALAFTALPRVLAGLARATGSFPEPLANNLGLLVLFGLGVRALASAGQPIDPLRPS